MKLKDATHIFYIAGVRISISQGTIVGETSARMFLKVAALFRMIIRNLIMESSLKPYSLILLLPLKFFLNSVTVYGGAFRI